MVGGSGSGSGSGNASVYTCVVLLLEDVRDDVLALHAGVPPAKAIQVCEGESNLVGLPFKENQRTSKKRKEHQRTLKTY